MVEASDSNTINTLQQYFRVRLVHTMYVTLTSQYCYTDRVESASADGTVTKGVSEDTASELLLLELRIVHL